MKIEFDLVVLLRATMLRDHVGRALALTAPLEKKVKQFILLFHKLKSFFFQITLKHIS